MLGANNSPMIFLLCFLFFISDLCASAVYRIDSKGITFIEEPLSLFDSDLLVASNERYSDGIYRLYEVQKNTKQRIVYNGDINELMHSLTWVHVHGYKDDWISFEKKLDIAKNRKLSMSCFSTTLFALQICDSLSIQARFVTLLSLEEWNSYNNGHSLLEVYHDGKWKLWDIDQRRYFRIGDKELNALELVLAEKDRDCQIIKFSNSPVLALTDLKLNNYDYLFWYEAQFFSEDEYRKFYKRSAQVLLVMQNGVFYFTCDAKDRKRIESYSHGEPFMFLEKNEFLNRFYP